MRYRAPDKSLLARLDERLSAEEARFQEEMRAREARWDREEAATLAVMRCVFFWACAIVVSGLVGWLLW